MVPVDGTTLVDHRVFVLGGDQEVLNGSATFEVGLNAIPTTDLFDAFTKTLCIGYDNLTLIFDFIGGRFGPQTPRFWHRFVDDTFVIHKEVNKQGFLQHINSVDPAIRFTVEDNKEDGSIPFLNTIVKSEADGTLSNTVYRNPLILTSTYSGTVTITSQPNLV